MLPRPQILFLCLIVIVHASMAKRAPIVQTLTAELMGYYKTAHNGREYEAYEGVPYAVPPVRGLRFLPPVPLVHERNHMRLATSFGSECAQFVRLPLKDFVRIKGSEDCLYLNIYTPVRDETNNTTPMPVIFWIHGGAFQYGSGMLTGVKYLMDRDVIVVTINYRLGPFGFFSTEDELVTGNMGLKDQSVALRWVSENIEVFGGNPKKITLVGLEAGGASVHYHYLSPWSAGLFQGGISISGTAFNSWALTENALEKAKTFSGFMGCPRTNSTIVLHCLKRRPMYKSKRLVSDYFVYMEKPFYFAPFGPVIEKFGVEPFINRTPIEIVNSGDVQDLPWITGVVNKEGLHPSTELIMHNYPVLELDEWYIYAPYLLDFFYTIPQENHIQTATLIKEHYCQKEEQVRKNEMMKMIGDRLFIVDSQKAARMQAKVNRSPVWYYYYTYSREQSLCNLGIKFWSNEELSYACHGDDALLVMNVTSVDPVSRSDYAMRQCLIDSWVSFATYGVPKITNVKWSRLKPSKKELDYLLMADPLYMKMQSANNLGEKDFWNSIDFNENKIEHASVKRIPTTEGKEN